MAPSCTINTPLQFVRLPIVASRQLSPPSSNPSRMTAQCKWWRRGGTEHPHRPVLPQLRPSALAQAPAPRQPVSVKPAMYFGVEPRVYFSLGCVSIPSDLVVVIWGFAKTISRRVWRQFFSSFCGVSLLSLILGFSSSFSFAVVHASVLFILGMAFRLHLSHYLYY